MHPLLVFAVAIVAAAASGCMERETGFEGQVLDRDTREPIAGAEVEAVQGESTVATALTDGEGRYTLALAPGTWMLEASAPGYEEAEVRGLALEEGEMETQDFFLARES